jgi:hypothetical protein
MFRMPAGFSLHREWEIELQATAEIRSVQLATSPVELV